VFFLGDLCFKSGTGRGEGEPYKAINYLEQLNCKNIVFIEGNHDCFSTDTKLLTINGYKFYNEIKIGDLIPTVNLNKKRIEYKPIKYITNFVSEKALIIKNKAMDGIFSLNHRHYLIPDHSNNKRNIKYQWNIKTSEQLATSWGGAIPSTFPSKNNEFKISSSWLSFFCWLHTDGRVVYYKNRIMTMIIYQSKEKNIIEIRELLKKLNINYIEKIRNRAITHICGKELKTIKLQHEFHILSQESRKIQAILKINKDKFPVWINKLSDDQIDFIIQELAKGDGSYTNTFTIQLWGKQRILEKWMGIFVTHNHSCRLIKDKRNHFYLAIHHRKRTGFSTSSITQKDMQIINYNKPMWGVNVDNHIIFVQRNGKPFITGNSGGRNSFKTIIQNLTISYGGKRIFLVHNPEHVNTYYDFALVGHVHEKWMFKRIRRGETFLDCCNVGVDVWNFYPVNWQQIDREYHKWLKENNLK
jgi:calcineurin-like phosphoesterase family protein